MLAHFFFEDSGLMLEASDMRNGNVALRFNYRYKNFMYYQFHYPSKQGFIQAFPRGNE